MQIDLRNDKDISSFIDITRGLAILLVIVVHFRNLISYTGGFESARALGYEPVISFFTFGAAGVALFFIISGFLMDYLYYQKMNIKSFALKRIARIFPAWFLWHIIALSVATLGLVWAFEGGTISMDYIFGSVMPINDANTLLMFFLSLFFLGFVNYSIWNMYIPGGWSIQAEVTHYTIFPFINKTNTAYILLLSGGMQFIGLITGVTVKSEIIASFITSPFWFFMGIVLSRGLRNVRNNNPIFSRTELILITANIGLTMPLHAAVIPQFINVITVVVSLLLLLILFKYQSVKALLSRIGKYSYGMYFNHFLLVVPISYIVSHIINTYNLLHMLIPIVIVGYVILTFVSYLIAKILYEYYEKFFIVKTNKYLTESNTNVK